MGVEAAMAEEQYSRAKISVWWDIENCHVAKKSDAYSIAKNIQTAVANMGYCGPISIFAHGNRHVITADVYKALISTGVNFTDVPPGAKNASDKMIMVDMLLWVADNAAPANILLISGDGDFTYALNQLRMRKHNILLAHPGPNVSASLVTAACCVWLWSSLSIGGPPLENHNSNYSCPNSVATSQPMSLSNNILPSQKILPNKAFSQLPYSNPPIVPPMRPNNFTSQPIFPDQFSPPMRPINSFPSQHTNHVQFSQPVRQNLFLPPTLQPSNKLSQDFRELRISENPLSDKKASCFEPRYGGGKKSDYNSNFQNHLHDNNMKNNHLFSNMNSTGTNNLPSSSFASGKTTSFADNGCGNLKLPDLQSLGDVVLIALDTLKNEKIFPNEENIADCIRYGDLKDCNIDAKQSLDIAVKQQIVIKNNERGLQFYLGKNEKLWDWVDPFGGIVDKYPKAMWDEIHQFLASSTGQSAILASQCRYEAATIMKIMCLKDIPLGGVIQILHLIVIVKKWIAHLSYSWQPFNITIPNFFHDPHQNSQPLVSEDQYTQQSKGFDKQDNVVKKCITSQRELMYVETNNSKRSEIGENGLSKPDCKVLYASSSPTKKGKVCTAIPKKEESYKKANGIHEMTSQSRSSNDHTWRKHHNITTPNTGIDNDDLDTSYPYSPLNPHIIELLVKSPLSLISKESNRRGLTI